MAKYHVYWETIVKHEAIVESDNEDAAWEETGELEDKDICTSSDFINDTLSITPITESVGQTLSPHTPANPDTLQTVCDDCGVELFYAPATDTWVTEPLNAAV